MNKFLENAPPEYIDMTFSDISDTVSFNGIFGKLLSAFNEGMKSCASMLCAACGVVLLLALFGNAGDEKRLSGVMSAVCCTALTAVCLPQIRSCAEAVSDAVSSAKVFSASAVPVISSFAVAGGESFSAVVFSSSVSVCIALFSFASESVMLPLCIMYLVLGLISQLSITGQIESTTVFIKKALKACTGVITAVLTLSLTLQKFLSTATDNVVKRSVKSAVGAFIPVLGTTLAGSVDSMFTLAANSKTSLSVLGIAVIAGIFMPPVLNNICCGGTMYAVKALAGALGVKKAEKTVSIIADSFFMLAGLCAVGAILMIISFLLICISL